MAKTDFPINPEVGSMFKVGFHKERVNDYIEGKNIFPVTLELDLTSDCTRVCQECPSVNSAKHRSLSMEFLERLFANLEGQTSGLLLTGGEPTMAPLFPKVLENARKYCFQEIAVVTNGSLINRSDVADALLKHATTIRLSIYDWDNDSGGEFEETLKRIEFLRQRVDWEGSPLKIGISALTSTSRVGNFDGLVKRLRDAGAHWIYFHPLCSKWGLGSPELADQDGVLSKIDRIRAEKNGGNDVFFIRERYQDTDLRFNRYHSAKFLLLVGADGLNYLAPEVKYQPKFVIADFNEDRRPNRLWDAGRLCLIDSINSQDYSPVQSRYRSILYNHFIEGLLQREKKALENFEIAAKTPFLFPHIL